MANKTLNFTAKEVLPALLKFFATKGKEGKNQTIRKAWEEQEIIDWFSGKRKIIFAPKPPKFQVGDEVDIVWDEELPEDSKFCSCHGEVLKYRKTGPYNQFHDAIKERKHIRAFGIFPKHLGKVKITEVFKIEMVKKKWIDAEGYNWLLTSEKYGISSIGDYSIELLAKADGFNSAEDMFTYFDKNYDLNSPKEFWVYKWE